MPAFIYSVVWTIWKGRKLILAPQARNFFQNGQRFWVLLLWKMTKKEKSQKKPKNRLGCRFSEKRPRAFKKSQKPVFWLEKKPHGNRVRVLQFASLLFLGHWPISFFSAHTSLAQVGREARKRAPCNHSALSYFEPSYSPKQKYHDFFRVFSYLRRLNPLSNDKIGQLIHPKLLGFIWMT